MKTTKDQDQTIKKLTKKGWFNLRQEGTNATMIKGPSYDLSKAVIDQDGTFLVYVK